jgi:pimeloyl-ACP methyl ester carboxylesterase
VFVHAGVADRRSWFDVIELVDDRGMRCVAYDQRGYGDTESTDEPYSHRDDLAAVLDDRGLDRVVVVGASRGGQIALDFALATADRVVALMLIGSAPGDAPFPPPPDAVIELFGAIERAEEGGDLATVNELEARVWLDGPMAPPARVGPPLRDLFLDMNGKALAATPSGAAAAFAPTWERLPTLQLPVSVLVGDLDVPGLAAATKATAERIPDAGYRVLRGTAHLPMLEQPSVIADEIATSAPASESSLDDNPGLTPCGATT